MLGYMIASTVLIRDLTSLERDERRAYLCMGWFDGNTVQYTDYGEAGKLLRGVAEQFISVAKSTLGDSYREQICHRI